MIPKFEIVRERPQFTRKKSTVIIDVSKYTEIKLINANEVCSNPKFNYAIALPLFGGATFFYPHEINNLKFYLNEKEVKFPTDSIERLYVELYKLLHIEYLKALVDEL